MMTVLRSIQTFQSGNELGSRNYLVQGSRFMQQIQMKIQYKYIQTGNYCVSRNYLEESSSTIQLITSSLKTSGATEGLRCIFPCDFIQMHPSSSHLLLTFFLVFRKRASYPCKSLSIFEKVVCESLSSFVKVFQ